MRLARNRHPEQTVERILDEAARLFVAKGFEKTSMQDIMRATGLSKGAIYHHFPSKEDILLRICDRIGQENAAALSRVRDNPSLNGAQKLKAIFRASLHSESQSRVLHMLPSLIDNPRFLAIQVQEIFTLVAPMFIRPILEEGIRDGSIRAEHPAALAEAIIVLSDLWMNPLLMHDSRETVLERGKVFMAMTRAVGVDVLDEEMIEVYASYASALSEAPPPEEEG